MHPGLGQFRLINRWWEAGFSLLKPEITHKQGEQVIMIHVEMDQRHQDKPLFSLIQIQIVKNCVCVYIYIYTHTHTHTHKLIYCIALSSETAQKLWHPSYKKHIKHPGLGSNVTHTHTHTHTQNQLSPLCKNG